MMPRLGFNNTYAIAIERETANLLKSKTIGALGGQEDLKVVFSHEFLERLTDGMAYRGDTACLFQSQVLSMAWHIEHWRTVLSM